MMAAMEPAHKAFTSKKSWTVVRRGATLTQPPKSVGQASNNPEEEEDTGCPCNGAAKGIQQEKSSSSNSFQTLPNKIHYVLRSALEVSPPSLCAHHLPPQLSNSTWQCTTMRLMKVTSSCTFRASSRHRIIAASKRRRASPVSTSRRWPVIHGAVVGTCAAFWSDVPRMM